MTVNSILLEVANTASKNEKIAILARNKDNNDLKTALQLALDPTINFYMKQLPTVKKHDGTTALWVNLNRLKNLSDRVYTGHTARDYVVTLLESSTEEDAEVLKKVITRDLKGGFGDSTVNKVWKNLIPEFPYMRCSLPKAVKLDTLSWEEGVYSQLKADGMFANVDHDADGNVDIRSRSGTAFPLTHFTKLVADVKNTLAKDTESHGELLVKRNGVVLPRQIGNGILNKIAQGGDLLDTDEITFLVWDQIALSSVVPKGSYNVPYKTRFANLKEQLVNATQIELIPTRIVHSMEEALVHYREMLAAGMEGTIIKCGNGEWKDGTSKFQVKMKLEITVDLVIKELTAGKGKNADTFGSITCQTSDGLLEVNVSGFIDKHPVDKKGNEIREPGVYTRKEIVDMWDELVESIMAVKSNSIMPPSGNNTQFSLFLPRFEEFRRDKKTADSLAQVQEQFENAIK